MSSLLVRAELALGGESPLRTTLGLGLLLLGIAGFLVGTPPATGQASGALSAQASISAWGPWIALACGAALALPLLCRQAGALRRAPLALALGLALLTLATRWLWIDERGALGGLFAGRLPLGEAASDLAACEAFAQGDWGGAGGALARNASLLDASWGALFGLAPLSSWAFHTLCAALAVALIFDTWRRLEGWSLGLVAALACALSTTDAALGASPLAESNAAFLSVLALWLFSLPLSPSASGEPSSDPSAPQASVAQAPRPWAWALGGAALAGSVLSPPLALCGAAFAPLLLLRRRDEDKPRWKRVWAAGGLAILGAALALAPSFPGQASRTDPTSATSEERAPAEAPASPLAGSMNSLRSALPLPAFALGLLILALCVQAAPPGFRALALCLAAGHGVAGALGVPLGVWPWILCGLGFSLASGRGQGAALVGGFLSLSLLSGGDPGLSPSLTWAALPVALLGPWELARWAQARSGRAAPPAQESPEARSLSLTLGAALLLLGALLALGAGLAASRALARGRQAAAAPSSPPRLEHESRWRASAMAAEGAGPYRDLWPVLVAQRARLRPNFQSHHLADSRLPNSAPEFARHDALERTYFQVQPPFSPPTPSRALAHVLFPGRLEPGRPLVTFVGVWVRDPRREGASAVFEVVAYTLSESLEGARWNFGPPRARNLHGASLRAGLSTGWVYRPPR